MLYHIEPIYKSFVWGGEALKQFFRLRTDQKKIGTVYHVISVPGDLDNIVTETGETLSKFYQSNKELFGINSQHFPIRMTTTANEGFQSYQVHPTDEFGLAHDNLYGKVSGAVALEESDQVRTRLFGNKAKSREELAELIQKKDWGNLFTTLDVKDGDFVHTPAGLIHGGYGDGLVTSTFGSNGDITYRFYDLDRNDPNRPLSIEKVIACSNVPEVPYESKHVVPKKYGDLSIYEYYDKPKEYIAKRLKINGKVNFQYEHFSFLAVVGGKGKMDGEEIGLGETIFVPVNHPTIVIEGKIDLIMVSYRE
ncbi:hypothetical protein [Atopobacter sp. AH10]|uniref:hypothetical protein n=1 Tax=Atopobacter sp. AH10 TaxID=2315861 RepID=UPI0018F33614|nr:hypothetical protein [Atopobacter sp. AH10]